MSYSSLRQIRIAFLVLAAVAMPAAASDFYTVPPCRLFDSRTDSTHVPPDNPLQAGVTYTLAAAGACGVPTGANAVSLNVTVIGPTGFGNLVVFAAGTPAPVGGVQFHPGQTKAMFQMVALGTGGDAGKLSFLATIDPPPSPPNYKLVIDITGYFLNQAPTDIALDNNTVAEGQPAGTLVGNLSTTDPDVGDSHTYSLVAGTGDTDNASFQISGSQLQTAVVLDFETQSSYSVRIRTTDSGGLFFEKVFTITATEGNDPPTDIALSPSSVDENQPSGTVVGTFSTTDQDVGDTHTYTLVAGTGDTDNGSFTIVGNQLQTAAVFDFETKSSYSIRVRSTDSGAGNLFFEKVFTITVNDANDAPTDIALSPSSVAEGQPVGTVVGTFSTTDQDAGDTHTYTLVAGTGDTDNGSFTIVGDQLQTAAVFDFETKSSYSIRVRSTDSGAGNLFFEKVFTITVDNANEAPTDIALSPSSVDENQPVGTVVGTFSTTDQDAGDTHTYTLVAGTGDTDNGSFTIVGSQLQTAAVFDFETKSSYSIRVRSTDSGVGNLFFEKVFTITIDDANDAPTDIALDNASVNENEPSGTAVGNFSTTDPDAGDTFTYTLVAGTGDTDNGSFAIVGNQLRTNAVFNFEVKNSYSIRVRSTDSGGLFIEEAFTISIINVPEAPIAGNDAYDTVGNTLLEVDGTDSEPAPKIYFNGNVLSNDVDPDGPTDLDVSLNSATPGAVVTFNNETGEFTYLPPAGATGTDSFIYNVTDGILTSTGTVTITLKHRVWYVKNDHGAGGLGRSTDPFDTLGEAETASAAGDTIHVYAGDGTTLGHTAGIALKANQRLIGEGVQLDVPVSVNGGPNPQFLRAAGSQPLLDRTGGTGECVRVNNVGGVEIRGLSLAGNANAIDIATSGGNSGGATIRNNTFRSAGAEGIDVTAGGGGTMTLDIQNNTWNVAGTHTGNAVDIVRTAGTMQINFSNNTNILSAATAVNINGGAIASTTITGFSGNNVHQNTVGTGINVSNTTFDQTSGGTFQTVSAGTTAVGTIGNGVGGSGMLLSGVAGDLSFSNLLIVADNGTGLQASGTTPYTGSAGFQITLANTAATKTVTATGGPAINLTTVSANLPSQTPVATQMTVTSTNSLSSGVTLSGVTGVFSADAGSSISNAGTTDFVIDSTSAAVVYDGTITDDVGQLVSVTNSGGSLKSFTGAITDGDDVDGGGISLTGNSSTIRFSGGVVLSTGGNPAFAATGGGGTVEVCDENPCNPGATGLALNKITTTTATALNVANVNIGTNNLEFRSISSNGGSSNGIILNTTGSSGGLKVKGTGSAGSGGTIQNKTGGNGSTTDGSGIYLNSTSGLSLDWMQLNDFSNYAIRGTGVTGFSMTNSVVNGANGTTNAGGSEEDSIRFDGLFTSGPFPTAQITNSTISGGFTNNVRVRNVSGTLNRLLLSNITFGLINAANGNDNVFVTAVPPSPTVATLNVTLQDCNFLGTRGDFFETIADGNSTMDVVARRNKFTNGQAIIPGGGVALSIRGDAAGTADNVTFDLSCNNVVGGHTSTGIFVAKGNGGGSWSGAVVNNSIGPTSGAGGDGIFIRSAGSGTISHLIQNNVVTGYGNVGIHLQNNDGSATMNATIFGNSVSGAGGSAFAGLFIDNGATATDTSRANVVVGSATVAANKNDFSTGDPANFSDVSLSNFNASTTFNLSRNGSANSTAAQIIDDDNLNPAATNTDTSGGVGAITAVNTLPTVPATPASCSIPP